MLSLLKIRYLARVVLASLDPSAVVSLDVSDSCAAKKRGKEGRGTPLDATTATCENKGIPCLAEPGI